MNGNNMNKELFFERNLYTKPNISVYPAKNFPAHYHKHVEFIYITEGSLTVTVDGKTETLSECDAAFIFPYHIHEYRLCGSCERFIAVFEPEFFGELSHIFTEYKPKNAFFHSDELCAYGEIISEILEKTDNIRSNDEEYATLYAVFLSKLCLLFALLLEASGIEKCKDESESPYFRAIKYCCDNFTDETLSVRSIAAALHISESRLQHIFSENLNSGVKDYVNTLRIDFSEKLLENTKLSITEIALRSGFSSLRTFNRVFMKKNGIAPGRFRSKAESVENI